MVSALVLVNTDFGVENEVLENVKHVNGVEEAHALRGTYDLIVRVKTQSIDKLRDIIKLGIRQIAGVSGSLTLMLIE